jgi:formylglycine-generating enzyme required for sulfatase activity
VAVSAATSPSVRAQSDDKEKPKPEAEAPKPEAPKPEVEAPKPEAPEKEGGGNGGPPLRNAPELPGFVFIPPGTVHPGCTPANYKARHQGGAQLKAALVYDIWGRVKPQDLQIPAYYLGRYEVTNAQWKLYLDREFRVEHECTGEDTLISLNAQYIRFRGKPVDEEWRAIYALNAPAIMAAIKKADDEARKKNPKHQNVWKGAWGLENPDPAKNKAISRVFLPQGLKLTFYKHRTPRPWFGWCRLSGLRISREYVDVTKPPAEAFAVPETELFKETIKLRANDFAAHPVRDLSSNEILEFCEWAGLHLPSEYEWERGVRGERPNTDQHPFPGEWKHGKEVRLFAWANNPISVKGPIAVDDKRIPAKSDTREGARQMLGNVWELTRTFYDLHPDVVPKPPEDPVASSLFNYSLTAKGGSHGDGWRLIQASTRTGEIGRNGTLDLVENNRADTIGFRLCRHPRPGYDLLMHSILKLAYFRQRGTWADRTPLYYNLRHMVGVDEVHVAPSESPYAFVQAKASAIAFAPVWISDMSLTGNKKLGIPGVRAVRNRWNSGKATGREHFVVGVLRSGVPIRAGVKLSKAEAAALIQARKDYAQIKKELERWEKDNKKRRKKKDAKPKPVLPPEPPLPDAYETGTEKNRKEIGFWREGKVEPGEWYVVYWYGYLGLANKALTMPPVAILNIPHETKNVVRERSATKPSTMNLNLKNGTMDLEFWVEEQLDLKKREEPPDSGNSNLWAWSEVHPQGWRRKKKQSAYSWHLKVTIPFDKDALNKHKWNK